MNAIKHFKIKKIISNDIFKNIIWLICEKIYYIILVFSGEGLISRTLGVTDYGKWLYSINLLIIISSIALVAGSEVMVPALSKHKRLTNYLITAAFLIRFFGAFIAYIILNVYSLYIIDDVVLKRAMLVLSYVLLLNEPFGIVVNYFQSKIRIKKVVFARCISLLIRTIFIAIAFHLENKTFIYFSRVVETLTLAMFLSILIYKENVKLAFDIKIFSIVLKRGLLLWIPLITMMIYLRVDRFFVEKYFSYDRLAMYGVAVQFMEQAFLLLVIIVQSLSPRYIFSSLNDDVIKGNIRKITFLLLAVVFVMQLVSFFVLPKIISIVFGEHYEIAGQIAVQLLPALIFYAIDTVLMQFLYRARKNQYILFKWVAMMLFSVCSYYIWFELLHQENLAIVFNINYLVMAVITYSIYKHLNCKGK